MRATLQIRRPRPALTFRLLLQQRGLTGALLEVEIPDQPLAVAQRFAMMMPSGL